jgi:hypothetical protein
MQCAHWICAHWICALMLHELIQHCSCNLLSEHCSLNLCSVSLCLALSRSVSLCPDHGVELLSQCAIIKASSSIWNIFGNQMRSNFRWYMKWKKLSFSIDIDAVTFLMSTLLEYGAELLSQCAIIKASSSIWNIFGNQMRSNFRWYMNWKKLSFSMDIDAVTFLMGTLLEYGVEALSQCASLKVWMWISRHFLFPGKKSEILWCYA